MKTHMLSLVAVGLLVCGAGATAYQNRRDAEQTESFSRTVRLGPDGRVTLANLSGTIVVTPGSGDEVSIAAVKRTRGDRRDLENVQIEVDERGGRVNVRTVYTEQRGIRMRGAGVSVDYTVSMPPRASLDVQSVSGDINVSNIKGTLSAEAVSGAVRITGASRVELAKTVSGPIDVSDSTLDQDFTATSVSGAIRISNIRGHGVQLKSVSGRLEAADLTCDRLDTTSISGRQEFTGPLARNGRYRLNSHSGSLRVVLSGNAGFELDAETFSGLIRSDFPVMLGGSTPPDRRGRSSRDRAIRATFGDASATLTLRTFSGSITLEKH